MNIIFPSFQFIKSTKGLNENKKLKSKIRFHSKKVPDFTLYSVNADIGERFFILFFIVKK